MIFNYYNLNIGKGCKILIFLIFTLPLKSLGQFDEQSSYFPPSPNVASSIKYANTPVNMYTGVPLISADLHVLECRNGFSIPISAFYHASGIKVQDQASNVGIGWTLSTNNVITRMVRGLPDESTTGYFGSDMGAKIAGTLDFTTAQDIMNGVSDGEPDLFYYSINGSYGKFVFDKDKNPVLLTNKTIRIINSPFKQELGVNGWILEDLEGNKFYFGLDANSTESTQSTAFGEGGTTKQLQFTSSWYMNKIVLPNNTETIQFSYESGNSFTSTNYSRRAKSRRKIESTFHKGLSILGIPIVDPSNDLDFEIVDADEWNNNVAETFSVPKYLHSIVSSNESAYFTYNSATTRQDLPGARILTNIEIKTYKNESLKTFTFNQSYFYSSHDVNYLLDLTTTIFKNLPKVYSDPSNRLTDLETLRQSVGVISDQQYITQLQSIAGPNISIDSSLPPDSPERYRLKLDNITLTIGVDPNTTLALYRFVYNDLVLPPRYSRESDHWGYFNRNIYDYFPDYVNPQGFFASVTAANADTKAPFPDRTQACILKKIIFQTGAYREFSFESNDFLDPKTRINQIGGGVRIKNIIDAGGANTPPIIARYSYKIGAESTGKLTGALPVYYSYLEHNFHQITVPFGLYTPDYTVPVPTVGYAPPPTDALNKPAPTGSGTFNYQSFGQTFVTMLINGNSVSSTTYSPFIIRSSVSFNNLYDIDGNSLGYSTVIIDNNQGQIVNQFSDVSDFPDYANQFRVNSDMASLGTIGPNLNPFTPNTSYAFARGLLKSSSVYDKNGVLLKSVINHYIPASNFVMVKGVKCAPGQLIYDNNTYGGIATTYYNMGNYNYVSGQMVLQQSIENNYEASFTPGLNRTLTYNYDSTYPTLLKSQTSQNSDGSTAETDFKYTIDKDLISYSNNSETLAANQLYDDGRLGLLLEQVSKKDNGVIQTKRTGYRIWTINSNQLTLPESIYQIDGTTPETKFTYQNYDQFGNVLQSGKDGGISNGIIWGYNSLFPIAQYQNANTQEIFFEDFENSNSSLVMSGQAHSGNNYSNGQYTINFVKPNNRSYKLTYWYRSNGVWQFSGFIPYNSPITLSQGDAIDDVLIAPSDATVLNNTYDALTGVTSATNVNRTATFYSYDNFHRLSSIKDNNGNIIKQYFYNQTTDPVPEVYLNTKISNYFDKNNCTIFGGERILYEIPDGKYYSYTSQQDADNQAQTDLNTNGQSYANGNGRCLVYARIEKEAVSNYYYFPDYDNRTQTAYIRFYINAACTVPIAVSQQTDVIVDYTETRWIYGVPYVYKERRTVTATAGSNSVNISYLLDQIQYTDTTKSAVLELDNYDFSLSLPNNITPQIF